MKQFETRSWKTNHRGLLAIAASAKWAPRRMICPNLDRLVRQQQLRSRAVTGCILGVVQLTDCIECTETTSDDLHLHAPEIFCGDFSPGRFAWKLENAQACLRPIRWKGHQSLRWLPDEVAEQVREQVTFNKQP